MVKAIETKEVIKEVEKTTVLAPIWFEYTGPGASDSNYDPHNPDNYTAVDSPSGPSCDGDEQVCGIKVNPDPESDPEDLRPNPSDLKALQSQINNMTPIPDQLNFRNES